MLSKLSCLESSQTNGRPNVSLSPSGRSTEDPTLLSYELCRIFLESENCILDACETDTCLIRPFHS
jgi:hypothetical protein